MIAARIYYCKSDFVLWRFKESVVRDDGIEIQLMKMKQIIKDKVKNAENILAENVYEDKPVNINEFVRIKYREKF